MASIYNTNRFLIMKERYVALMFPEYQEFMEKPWFEKEAYYCVDKDIYFIPETRYVDDN